MTKQRLYIYCGYIPKSGNKDSRYSTKDIENYTVTIIITTTNKPDFEFADDGLVLELGRPDADPGFVADPVLFVGEKGFSVSHLWLLPLGAAVAGDGFKGFFATSLVAAPPYTVNLKQKGYRDLQKNVKKYHTNCKIAFIKVLISENIPALEFYQLHLLLLPWWWQQYLLLVLHL